MIDNSYSNGFDISIQISIGIGIIFFIIIFIKNFIPDCKYNAESLGGFLILLIFSVGVSIASFLLIYPLCNLLFQNFLSLEIYKKEISQGTLALRFTSILLGFNFLKSLYNFFAYKLLQNQKELIADYPDLQKIEPRINEAYIDFILVSQNLIYGTVTLLLWVFVFLSKSLLELRVVTWGLFFIIDDWAIISDNLIALKGRILKWHKFRIIFFNNLLSIFITSACFRQLDNLLFSIIISVALFFLVLLNAILYFYL